jgi:ABC-2 type transport system ATP-binding protein
VSVFFSSHLLYEIEPVADSVVILDHGKVVRQSATDDLRSAVKRLIAPSAAEAALRALPGVLDFSISGRQASVVVEDISAARPALAMAGITAEEIDLNLDEIFEAIVIGRRKDGPHVEPSLERMA